MIVFRTRHNTTWLYPDGKLANEHAPPSDSWRLTGAIEYGRGYTGGHVVHRYTLQAVRRDDSQRIGVTQ